MMTRTPIRWLPSRFLRPGPIVPLQTRQWIRRPLVFCSQLVAPKRQLHVSTILLPPVVFVGLLGALWAWKCLMMVTFQNKIIYIPGMPPNTRRERINDYAAQCGGVQWREHRIRAADGTGVALCVASMATSTADKGKIEATGFDEVVEVPVYILYFQGNASSIPPRLPDISWVLQKLADRKPSAGYRYDYTIACLSYRGYWTSQGRPSEKGINLDTEAAARWVAEQVAHDSKEMGKTGPVLIIWGQSIGAGFATNLAVSRAFPSSLKLNALLLETPFLSVRAMLEALYPQKWLPYRHLWPFLWNHLDNWSNLGVLGEKNAHVSTLPTVIILEAGRDEIVPSDHGAKLYDRCKALGIPAQKITVKGAYHNEASFRLEGKGAIASAIEAEVAKNLPGRY